MPKKQMLSLSGVNIIFNLIQNTANAALVHANCAYNSV